MSNDKSNDKPENKSQRQARQQVSTTTKVRPSAATTKRGGAAFARATSFVVSFVAVALNRVHIVGLVARLVVGLVVGLVVETCRRACRWTCRWTCHQPGRRPCRRTLSLDLSFLTAALVCQALCVLAVSPCGVLKGAPINTRAPLEWVRLFGILATLGQKKIIARPTKNKSKINKNGKS